jgi:hypothetical protein
LRWRCPEEKRSDIQPFIDGVVLVSQQVNDVLAEMGVQPIATVGETFDPHYHEAVATEESDEMDPNTISAELLRGYRIGERVIRHSMVRVTTQKVSEGSNPSLSEFEEVDAPSMQADPQSDPDSGENPNEEN